MTLVRYLKLHYYYILTRVIYNWKQVGDMVVQWFSTVAVTAAVLIPGLSAWGCTPPDSDRPRHNHDPQRGQNGRRRRSHLMFGLCFALRG